MKRKIIILISIVLILLVFVGCGNRQFLDTTYTFNYGIIKLANGEIVEGRIESWKDFDDGDSIQVKINGETYLVHLNNASLITKKNIK